MDPNPSCISKSRRTLKIVYDDSDATDSSSDERIVDPTKRKRVVLGILFPNVPYDQTTHNELSKNNKSCGTPKNEVKQPSCTYKGVRMRQWGRYTAEIRNPINGKCKWLGTFDSAEEASKAYEAKRHEFETTHKNKRLKKVSFIEAIVSSFDDSDETNSSKN